MNTRKIIDVIKVKCQEAPERAPDYYDALLDTVSDIVWAEHQHTIRATTIQQKVTDYCEALGDYIQRNAKDEKINK
jgi:fructose-1,6-bisphosphatase